MTGTAREECPRCNAPVPEQVRHCPTCSRDVGAPNVRYVRRSGDLDALATRFRDARERAHGAGKLDRFDEFVEAVEQSSVVIAVPASVALNLVQDERTQFVNYEQLVGGNMRSPAPLENDAHRRAIAGTLFPSYGEQITYGVLAIGTKGLSTYGDVFLRLRPEVVADRCTFIERNSFDFVEQVGERDWPLGYMCDWDHRAQLAGAKLVDRIISDKRTTNWDDLLVHSEVRREDDEFVEAHIFETFNVHSIESIVPANYEAGSQTATLVELALEAFQPGTA